MRKADIVIVSDAWYPQVNGVVRTLDAVRQALAMQGRDVTLLTPENDTTIACPLYPEVRLSLNAWQRIPKQLESLQPRYIHIATEGPLGLAARRYCRRHGYAFTSSYHTKFPEYLNDWLGLPKNLSYYWLRRFHDAAHTLLVATPSLQQELTARGFEHTALWSRGVDTTLFRPIAPRESLLCYPRPILLSVGRVSSEKNLDAFLRLPISGTKLVVGDGPKREALQRAYPDAVFVGAQQGEALARYYAGSDVFVFPSKSDTFGLVMLEALACGTPVAAYPVPGPLDVITDPKVGALDWDLAAAITRALTLPRDACVAFAHNYSWQACAARFSELLVAA